MRQIQGTMSLQERYKQVLKFVKWVSAVSGSSFFIAYHIQETCKSIDLIVNPKVLEREKKHQPEYIYVEDPSYKHQPLEFDKETKQAVGFSRIWKSLKHSVQWRLLWLCRHGNKDQRNIALEQLAAFKNNKLWDCCKLAQALDKNTAVLLARTRGADLRYFLPPPTHVRRAALSCELLSFKLRDLIYSAQSTNAHSCIQHFLSKYFTNIQEQAMDADSIPCKPDSISERELCMLCLDALYHHVSLFTVRNYEEDTSIITLVKSGLLSIVAEAFLRFRNDNEFDLAILRVLTVLSVHCNLLTDFYQTGLIGELARLLKSTDIRLASSAAVCLSNLSGEHSYRPGLYLLHPLYRTTTPHACDTLLVHGLRGGVFVTWRQRDKNCNEPLGIMEVTISDIDCEPHEYEPKKPIQRNKFLDIELQQVVEDMKETEDEATLSDFDVVLHDVPIVALREPCSGNDCVANKKRVALIEEEEDKYSHTHCWPKDWLPKDCANLRILGVNYWSSLSEWVERCPFQPADIATRASNLVPALLDAEVGRKNIPIVWLAHSMGGLIVKQVLVEASQSKQKQLKHISENTKAVLFYSTPHKGSSLATMPRAAAVVLWPSTDVRQLQENSPTLLDLHKAFIKYSDAYGWETISFAESEPTLVTAFKVPIHFVHSHSADLGRGVFYQLPLDHLSICKPATRQSIIYTTVLDVLQRATLASQDLEMHYQNPVMQWLQIFLPNVSHKGKGLIHIFDEKQTSDRLPWIERLLLENFATDFTD